MKRNIYKTYKEPIYSDNKKIIRTDGYYIQISKLEPNNSYRDLIIFFDDGYVTSISLLQEDLENEINNKIKQTTDTIVTDFDWWKVKRDSLIIENYAEMKLEMSTWNYYLRGLIISDSIIELKCDDSYLTNYKPILYQFVKTDSLPNVKNKGRYLRKDWYKADLNEDRKK